MSSRGSNEYVAERIRRVSSRGSEEDQKSGAERIIKYRSIARRSNDSAISNIDVLRLGKEEGSLDGRCMVALSAKDKAKAW